MKFSFLEKESYIPIAQIVSQDNLNGEILFLDPNMQHDDDESFNFDKQTVNYNKYMKNMTAKDMNKKSEVVSKYLQKQKEPEDSELKSIYKNIIKDGNKDIILKKGSFVPIPDPSKDRVNMFITGPAGSGKSWFASSVLQQWTKLHPKGEIFLFSQLFDDPILDKLKNLHRVDVNTLLEEPIDVYDIPEGSFVIFDDVDSIPNKKILEQVEALENSIHQVGRKLHINIIRTSHLSADGRKTRMVLSECQYIVVYPSSGSWHQIQYVLKTYVGLSNQDLAKIKSLRSRWVMISKQAPQYVLSEHECYLVSQ
jgi:adenosyl cobinamide kinase/adenosyl cobinamide phosphate guanylyltransferase